MQTPPWLPSVLLFLLLHDPSTRSAAGHKLENFLDPEEHRVDPSASDSLAYRQPRFFFVVS